MEIDAAFKYTWSRGVEGMDTSHAARKLRSRLREDFANSSLHGNVVCLSDIQVADRPAVLELIQQGYTLTSLLA